MNLKKENQLCFSLFENSFMINLFGALSLFSRFLMGESRNIAVNLTLLESWNFLHTDDILGRIIVGISHLKNYRELFHTCVKKYSAGEFEIGTRINWCWKMRKSHQQQWQNRRIAKNVIKTHPELITRYYASVIVINGPVIKIKMK